MRRTPLEFCNWSVPALVLSLFLLSNSCRKIDIAAKTQSDAELIEAFLKVPGNAAPELKRIAQKLQELHQKAGFLTNIGKQEGLPIWNKAVITSHQNQNSRKKARTNAPGDTIVYIPLVIPNEKEVNAFIYARLNGNIHLDLFNSASYAGYGFGKITDTSNNAEKLAVQFMILNNIVFDYNDFKILDNHLFKGSTHSNEKDKSVHISHISNNGSIAQRGNGVEFWEYEVCTSHKYLKCSSDNRCCPDGSCSACKQECWKDSEPVCEKVTVIVFSLDDDPGPGSGEGGSGGGGGLGGAPTGGPAACNPTPSLDNGLPPCPRGGSDGWEPVIDQGVLDPCAAAQNLGKEMDSIFTNSKADSTLSTITDLATGQNERGFPLIQGFTINPWNIKDTVYGALRTGAIETGTPTGIVYSYSYGTKEVPIGNLHTHPRTGYTCPSSTDMYDLVFERMNLPRFRCIYVAAFDSSQYAISINDYAKALSFYNTKPQFLNDSTNGWKEDSEIGLAYEKARLYFKETYKDTTSDKHLIHQLAMAATISQFNIGITMFKKDSSGHFKPLMVKRTVIPKDRNNKKEKVIYTIECI